MSADAAAAHWSAGGTLQVRVSLLASVKRYNEAQEPLPTNQTSEPATASTADTASLLKTLVQRNPSVTNPSWAMEECGRLCPNAELWCGSALSKDVWAPPGTSDCPFGTQPADYRIQH